MDGRINSDELLDYATFQISPVQNRYEAFICSKGEIERLDSGILEQLVVHLRAVNFEGLGNSFKLELPQGIRGASWFNKSTLSRFLHIVGAPQLWKNMNVVLDEVSQLEEARQFHLALYTQGPRSHPQNGVTDNNYRKEREQSLNSGVCTMSSDATKNELLQAMDLRLAASRTELIAALEQAAGATCSIEQITLLDEFARHFGAADIRNSISKYLALGFKKQPTEPVNNGFIFPHHLHGNTTEGTPPIDLQVDKPESGKAFLSPAKVAEVECRSLTESEESSGSSEDDKSPVERSRSLVRSASPKRSASPMRRVQIGRSGSRRATAIAIKSLGFIPAREKLLSNRNALGNSSEDEDTDQPAKKPESTVRRMSVQDAINLFENKQRDQKSEIQKLRSSAEISSTNKLVLRRWSSGMGDSSTQSGADIAQGAGVPGTDDNSKIESPQSSDLAETNAISDIIETADVVDSTAADEKASFNNQDLVVAGSEDVQNKVPDSVEWTRQKEAELNQMLMKMMESKPNRYGVAKTGNEKAAIVGERRGTCYDHYREKRDEKLRGENAGKRVQKEAQFKAIHHTLDQRKAEMVSKNGTGARKQDSPSVSRNARRTSSPSLGQKKELSPKPTGVKKAAKKSSTSLPATRNSWPSTPSPRSIAPSPTKASGPVSSAGPVSNHRKSQGTPSLTHLATKVERTKPEDRSSKVDRTGMKPRLKNQDGKKPQLVTKNSKPTKPKNMTASADDSVTTPAKPSFYNKVTKKGSVVPLETKPFLRKGTGMGPIIGGKAKTSQSDESSKNSGNLVQDLGKDVVVLNGAAELEAETTNQLSAENPVAAEDDEINLQVPVNNEQTCENKITSEASTVESADTLVKTEEFPVEIQPDEDLGISASAWVEVDPPELLELHDDGHTPPKIVTPAVVGPVTISSPRVRHSLSQMLQAENGESESIEWGNAENPPALVYQKESPKGLKRLLKFARKSKGEANSTGTGWASPSVFSEGEDDAEEAKGISKKHADALLRKAALQAKGCGQHKSMSSGSYDDRSSNRTMGMASHDIEGAEMNITNLPFPGSNRRGQTSTTNTSSKGTRSFFSLSTFRSNKSETKLR
ncbi:COP1-interacting protein 7-like [Aristolochia californica]|uniref:COP1-interacting protein 7-like n=1 Tax=Aristolochia californica TaxID=171875 RepID=UPI0035DCAB38